MTAASIQEHKFTGSTNVDLARYNPEAKTLDVLFLKGAPYRYFGFQQEKFDRWKAAKSAGGFMASEIARKYQCVRLECTACHERIDPVTEFDVFLTGGGRMCAYHKRCSKGVNAEMVKL